MSRHPWPASSVEGGRPTGSGSGSRVERRHGAHRWPTGLPVEGLPAQTAARHSEPIGDLDVVNTHADGGDGEVLADARSRRPSPKRIPPSWTARLWLLSQS